MAQSTTGYSNREVRSGQTTQEFKLGVLENYAVIKDEPSEVILDNITAPIDSQELIGVGRRKIAKVNNDLNIQFPSGTNGGVQCVVSIQQTVTDQLADDSRVDYPAYMQLLWRNPLVGVIDNDVLGEMFERLGSYLRHEADNSYRFDEIMRGAIRPTKD